MLMRALGLGLALALLAPAPAQAKIYYLNKGVKYHIGDGRVSASEDREFLDSYPVVGPRWIQAFTVDREDTVKVRIDNLWGVDDCAYCHDMIYIDQRPLARLYEENNHDSFTTPLPLSMQVKPGHVYLLRIESEGLPGPIDDFAIEGVSVESSNAEVTLLEPGPVLLQPDAPLPQFTAPLPVVGPCDGTQAVTDWLPPVARSKGMIAWSPSLAPVQRRLGAGLDPGTFAKMVLRVEKAAQGGPVDQFFEIVAGEAGNGWVLSFPSGGLRPFAGNVKVDGRYRGDAFTVNDWKEGAWNDLQIARCKDGLMRLWINGRDVGVSLPGDFAGNAFRLRCGGLKAQVALHPY